MQKSNNKTVFIILSIVLLLVGLFGLYWYVNIYLADISDNNTIKKSTENNSTKTENNVLDNADDNVSSSDNDNASTESNDTASKQQKPVDPYKGWKTKAIGSYAIRYPDTWEYGFALGDCFQDIDDAHEARYNKAEYCTHDILSRKDGMAEIRSTSDGFAGACTMCDYTYNDKIISCTILGKNYKEKTYSYHENETGMNEERDNTTVRYDIIHGDDKLTFFLSTYNVSGSEQDELFDRMVKIVGSFKEK